MIIDIIVLIDYFECSHHIVIENCHCLDFDHMYVHFSNIGNYSLVIMAPGPGPGPRPRQSQIIYMHLAYRLYRVFCVF